MCGEQICEKNFDKFIANLSLKKRKLSNCYIFLQLLQLFPWG